MPRIEIKHTLDDANCQCEQCKERMVPLSEKITEQLDIIPAKVRVLRHHRTAYHCPGCKDALITALLPPKPIPKSNATPSLLAWLIIAKYLDGATVQDRAKAQPLRHALNPINTGKLDDSMRAIDPTAD